MNAMIEINKDWKLKLYEIIDNVIDSDDLIAFAHKLNMYLSYNEFEDVKFLLKKMLQNKVFVNERRVNAIRLLDFLE